MPAEWEPHVATWLTWPHCEDTWPARLADAVPAYVEMIRALSRSERVYVNTLSEAHRDEVRAHLKKEQISTTPESAVRVLILPTDDEWIRDYGALFVRGPNGLVATDWQFNAWGRKYDRIETNNRIPATMAMEMNTPRIAYEMVLEGGAIDVNGQGACLTTESCLLNPNRNPELSRRDIEAQLQAGLGVEEVIWLGDGIVGDDTDGHIDDLARFVGPRTVVTAIETDPSDDNHEPLVENLRRLKNHRMHDSEPLETIELPMPAPLFHEEQRLPASYVNFYIANKVVLLPTFDDPKDEVARNTLQNCFPTREVVPIDARALVWGFGSCHCLTQQVPAVSTP